MERFREKKAESCVTPCSSVKKVNIPRKIKKPKRKDFSRNEELVFSAFLLLEKELGKKPTRIQVAKKLGLSRQKVGQYFRKLNL